MALSGTLMLAVVPRCNACDKLAPEHYIYCGEPDAGDRGCEVARVLEERQDAVARLDPEDPAYKARRVVMGHRLVGRKNIFVAIPKEIAQLYAPPLTRFELWKPAGRLPNSADAKLEAYSSAFFQKHAHAQKIGCAACCKAKKGPCGTDRPKFADCEVVFQMNVPENADALDVFDGHRDSRGAFLYCLLKILEESQAKLPTVEMINKYLEGARRPCRDKIREALPEGLRGQVAQAAVGPGEDAEAGGGAGEDAQAGGGAGEDAQAGGGAAEDAQAEGGAQGDVEQEAEAEEVDAAEDDAQAEGVVEAGGVAPGGRIGNWRKTTKPTKSSYE